MPYGSLSPLYPLCHVHDVRELITGRDNGAASSGCQIIVRRSELRVGYGFAAASLHMSLEADELSRSAGLSSRRTRPFNIIGNACR